MREIDPAPDLARYGATLRAAREARRVSLDEAGRATRIRAVFLDAIERGDLARFDSPVYAAGHVRIYSRFLDVDPTPYLTALAPPAIQSRTSPSATASFSIGPVGSHNRTPFVILVALLVLGVYLVKQYTAFVASAATFPTAAPAHPLLTVTPMPTGVTVVALPTVVPTATVAIPQTTPAATPSPVPTAVATPTIRPSPAAPTGVLVETLTTGRVWIQVETDNRVVFSGILNSGDRRRWTANQQLLLWTGDAGNISVTYNGKDLGRLGSPGQVLKVTWTATS